MDELQKKQLTLNCSIVSLEEALAKENSVAFMNKIRTDGFTVEFLFARKKRVLDALPELDFVDFSEQELKEDFHLWGADPGRRDVFVMVDGHESHPHQVRRISTAEYYTVAGYNKTRSRIQNAKTSKQIDKIETSIPSPKTATLEGFAAYLSSLLPNLSKVLSFYGKEFAEWRFLNYQGKQRANEYMLSIFVDGGDKYNEKQPPPQQAAEGQKKKRRKKNKGQTNNKEAEGSKVPQKANKWRKQAFQSNDGKVPLIAFGNAMFSDTSKGYQAGLTKVCRRLLKKAERQGRVCFIPIDEYNTSQ